MGKAVLAGQEGGRAAAAEQPEEVQDLQDRGYGKRRPTYRVPRKAKPRKPEHTVNYTEAARRDVPR